MGGQVPHPGVRGAALLLVAHLLLHALELPLQLLLVLRLLCFLLAGLESRGKWAEEIGEGSQERRGESVRQPPGVSRASAAEASAAERV